jgi:hypothetical protein
LPSATTTFDANVACGNPASAELRLFLIDERLEQLGDSQRLQFFVRLDQDCAVLNPSSSKFQLALRVAFRRKF